MKLLTSAKARFAKLLSRCKTNEQTGCIEAQRSIAKRGYARAWNGLKIVYAHRLAWEAAYGPIPSGMDVLHTCDVRHCVNVAHLYLGTDVDNARDTVMRTGFHSQKLTPRQVLEIRIQIEGGKPLNRIAQCFGLSPSSISNIHTGRTWKCV